METDQQKLLRVNTSRGTTFLDFKPEPTYIVKSPGLPVRLVDSDGKVVKTVYMNRAERRRNKIRKR